jgi:DNA-binding CsgD family transcriptional regulator
MRRHPRQLRGRASERRVLDDLIAAVRGGESRALVVHGPPGVGKTALLDYLADHAAGCRVARTAGVQSEMEIPYAAVQQLCGPMLDGLDHLPAPQADALRVAFGLSRGPAPDLFLVGLALLGLLSEIAQEQPLVCLIDDEQWLDSSSALVLAFAARRLGAESVALVFGTRKRSEDLAAFPEVEVGGLQYDEARALLDSTLAGPLDARVRDQIVTETGGNPLALLELPWGLTPAELAGGFGLPRSSPLAGSIEDSFRRQIDTLPLETRRLLLLAAADPTGDPALVWRAATRLEISPDHITPAIEADLAEFGNRVRFRHPLIRSAAYHSVTAAERRQAHRALADATDPGLDPDRQAWHLARATTGPDEQVAAALEQSAERAQSRGGLAAAAAFLEQAARLSLDSDSRTRRILAAAESKHLAGAHNVALDLLAAAEMGSLTEPQKAQADQLRAEIAYLGGGGTAAPQLLLRAAKRLEPLDVRAARYTYLNAVIAAGFAGRLGGPSALRETAQAARRAPRMTADPSPADLFLDGLVTAHIDGYCAGAPLLIRAVNAFHLPGVPLQEELRWLWPTSHAAMALWDDASYETLAARHIELGRGAGLLAILPTALTNRIVAHAFFGEFAAADHLVAEQQALTEAVGIPLPPYGPLLVAAWRGEAEEASAVIDAAIPEITARGEGGGLALADYARAVLNIGLGRYREALTAATATDAFDSEGLTIYSQGLSEIIESAARVGSREQAIDALSRLVEMADITGTDWAAGVRARSEALLTDSGTAEPLYVEAIERLGRTRIRPQLGRSHLLYGEWLRRQRRRTDAREQLRTAHRMFEDMGMAAFAERARRELEATGETVRKRRRVTGGTELTAQEAQIARLARDGLSNPEIGARLFISAHTVQYHLRKVFTKLGITSRTQLDRVLPRK